MAFLTRGKRMLTASIKHDIPKKSRRRGLSPFEEAEWFIQSGLDKEGLQIQFISKEIGSGVFATFDINRGDFLCEYVGERISRDEGERRDKSVYRHEQHSYLYYFRHNEKELCIDASRIYGRVGRTINDSISPNSRMKKVYINGCSLPYLAVFATRSISAGEEIVYDYGEVNLPWRKQTCEEIEMEYDPDPFDLDKEKDVEPNVTQHPETWDKDAEVPADGPVTDTENDPDPFDLDKEKDVEPNGTQHPETWDKDAEVPADGPVMDTENDPDPFDLDKEKDVEPNGTQNPETWDKDAEVPADGPVMDTENDPDPFDLDKEKDVEPNGTQNPETWDKDAEVPADGPVMDTEYDPDPFDLDKEKDVEPNGTQHPETWDKDAEVPADGPVMDTENDPDPFDLDKEKDVEPNGTQNPETWDKDAEVQADGPVMDTEYDPDPFDLDKEKDVEPNITQNPETWDKDAEVPADGPVMDTENDPDPFDLDKEKDVEPNGTQNPETWDKDAEVPADGPVMDTEYDPDPFDLDKEKDVEPNGTQHPETWGISPDGEQTDDNSGYVDFHILGRRNPPKRLCKADVVYVPSNLDSDREETTGSEFEVESDYVEDSEGSSDEFEVTFVKRQPVLSGCEKETSRSTDVNTRPEVAHPDVTSPNMESSKIKVTSPDDRPTKCTPAKSAQRPGRFCIFCKETFAGGKLKRHMMRKHKNEEEVKEALKKPKALLNKFFELKRTEGMYEFNMRLLASKQPNECKSHLMRERRAKNDQSLKMCSGCKRFFSTSTFYRHREHCSTAIAEPVKLSMLGKTGHRDPVFNNEILTKFRSTEAGLLCQQDELIQQVGYRHFCLRRYDTSKKDEVRKCVMTEMRDLARLFLMFRSLTSDTVTTEEMFTRQHLPDLREAIERLSTTEEGKEKYGLKLNLNAIIMRTIKSLKGLYTELIQDQKFEEINKFQQAYSFRSHEMFSGARYKCLATSMDKARKPQALPEDRDLKVLKTYIEKRIKEISENFEVKHYVELRSLTVCRLTLYNGRRGEEPARMLLSEWRDAVDGVWLPPEKIQVINDPAEEFLAGKFLLGYLHGKGKKFVPILIPKDLMKPVNLLLRHRAEAGIMETNPFLFAATVKSSGSHSSGWQAVRNVSQSAGVKVNANANRHRISTIYASLDMNPAAQQTFFDHMGHEASISKDNYQCPSGLREIRVMGKLLNDIDQGVCTNPRSQNQEPIQEEIIPPAPVRPEPVENASAFDEDEPVSGDRPKKLTVTWTEEGTQAIVDHFDHFFHSSMMSGHNNKGSLPSKAEIMDFLKKNMPSCLDHLSLEEAYKKTRTKLFNQRKTRRSAAQKRIFRL